MGVRSIFAQSWQAIPILGCRQENCHLCHLRFKSERLGIHNLRPKGDLRLYGTAAQEIHR